MKMRLVLLAMLSLQGTPLQQTGTGTVIGRVISRDSRPNSTAVGIVVRARSLERATFVSFTQTDESGGYRLEGIPPGRYYIEAGLLDLPTYYPGAAELIDAKPVNVVAGSTVTGISFALSNPVDIQVKGRVVIAGGGAIPLDVAGLIGSALPASSVPNAASLIRMISQRTADGVRASVTVRTDGSFAIALPPGENHIVVQSLPLGYYVKSIVAGGLDILQSPLIVSEGTLPEVLVTLTRTAPASSPLTVTVRGNVMGVPSDASPRWVILQSGTTGPAVFGIPSTIAEIPIQADGTFEVRGVPPGNYFISTKQALQPPNTRQALVVPSEGLSGVELTWAAPRPARGASSAPPPLGPVSVRGKIDSFPRAMPSNVRLISTTQRQPSREAIVRSDGTFEFDGVAWSEYELRIGRDAVSVGRNFTVGTQDIAGIELKSAVEARGLVVMADGSNLPSPVFQIQSEYAAGNPGTTRTLPTIQREFEVRSDGTFIVGVVRGEQRVSVLGLPAAYSVKSIAYSSTDLLASPLSLSAPPTSEILVTLEPTGAADPGFRFVYQYGHGTLLHPNSVDSARGTYTKDMVVDPPRTFNLKLTVAELDQIQETLDDIDFWNAQKYPPVFAMPNPGPRGCSSTGRQPIFLFVTRGSTSKELTWLDRDTVCGPPNRAGADLRALMKLISGIIQSKPEYQSLPRPRATYID